MLTWVFILTGLFSAAETRAQIPVPLQVPHVESIGEHEWSDPFHWMNTLPHEEPKPELLHYLKSENAYTDQWMSQNQKLHDQLLKEFQKNEPRLYLDEAPQIVNKFEIKINDKKIIATHIHNKLTKTLFDGEKFFPEEKSLIQDFRVSQNQKFLALFLRVNETLKLYFYEVKSKNMHFIPTAFSPTDLYLEFTPDEKGFYYAINSAFADLSELYYYDLEKHSATLLRKLSNIRDQFELSLSQDQEYLLVFEKSYSHREAYALPVNSPESTPTLLIEKKPLRFTYANHDNAGFILQTNLEENHFDLYRKTTLGSAIEKTLEASLNRDIDSFEVYDDFYFVTRRDHRGLPEIEIYSKEFKLVKNFRFKESNFTLTHTPHRKKTHTNRIAQFVKSGVVTPETRYQFDLKTGLKVISSPGSKGYENQIEARHLEYLSKDGSLVPLTLVYKKGLDLNVPHPVYYSAYGSYATSYDLNYTHSYSIYQTLSLAKRGVIVAIAHVRGGADKGLHWYLGGREKNKIRSYEDFISGAEYLISKGITLPKKIAIASYSAGGFLVGNALALRPELWSSALIYMGFTDYIGAMLDPRVPFTCKEWDLVGDPRNPDDFSWIKTISPQENLKPQAYPDVMVWSAMSDPDVLFDEGARFVAKLRTVRTNHKTTLYRIIAPGEGEHDGSYESYLDDVAQSMAFVLKSF